MTLTKMADRRVLLIVVFLTGLSSLAHSQEDPVGDRWLQMTRQEQVLYVWGFHAGLAVLSTQTDSERVKQFAAHGIFQTIKDEHLFPIIYKVNGFYQEPKHNDLSWDVPVFLAIAFVKEVPLGVMESFFIKPNFVREFYQMKSVRIPR